MCRGMENTVGEREWRLDGKTENRPLSWEPGCYQRKQIIADFIKLSIPTDFSVGIFLITKNGYACWLVTQQPDCYLMGTAIWVM